MRTNWLPAAVLVLASIACNTALADDGWYLGAVWITHDRLEFRPTPGNGSTRDVYDLGLFSGHDFPLFGDEPPGSPSLRGHMRFDCEHNQMQVIDSQDLDRAGRVTRTYNNALPPREVSTYDPAWQRVFDSVCQGQPTHWARPPRQSPRATPSAVLHGLISEDRDQKQWAITQIETEPGAFTPDVLLGLATTLAESRQPDEAMHWWLLGLMRAYTDAYALHSSLTDASDAERALLEDFERVSNIAEAFRHLSPARRAELIGSIVAEDQRTPRYYPIDWPSWPAAQYINWTAPRNAPGTDFVARARLNRAREDARRQISRTFEG